MASGMTLVQKLATIAREAREGTPDGSEAQAIEMHKDIIAVAESMAECGTDEFTMILKYPKAYMPGRSRGAINKKIMVLLAEDGFRFPVIRKIGDDYELKLKFEE